MPKVKKKSPAARSLKLVRENGYIAEVVERWNPHVKIRQDLFGIVDIVAVHPEKGWLLIQATSAPNLNAREKKISESEHLQTLLTHAAFEVHGWGEFQTDNGRKSWQCKIKKMLPEVLHESIAC